MTWFKVDDQLAFHPKVLEAGNAAMGLWVRAGSWCSAHLTQGELPRHMIGTFGAQHRHAEALVRAGLWTPTDVGYQFKDWEHYQPDKDQVEDRKASNRDRQKRYRDGKRNAVSNGVTDSVTNGVSNTPPSRPVPSVVPKGTTQTGSLRSPAAAQRGTRLPDDWQPSTDLVDQMRQECPGVDLRAEHRVFVDYYRSASGQKGVMLDWPATWRNWMRREAKFSKPGRTRAKQSTTDAGIAAIQAMKHPQRLEIA